MLQTSKNRSLGDKEYLSRAELATLAGCSLPVVDGWIHHPDPARQLPASRTPGGSKIMIRRADFEEWLDRNRVEGKCAVRQTRKSSSD